MKKNYMKPEGSVVALRVNENIAASTDGGIWSMDDDYAVYTNVGTNGKWYIQDTNVLSCEVADEAQAAWLNMLTLIVTGQFKAASNCYADI